MPRAIRAAVRHGWRQALYSGNAGRVGGVLRADMVCPRCGLHFQADGLTLARGGRAMCNGITQVTETREAAEAHKAKVREIRAMLADAGWSFDGDVK